MMENKEPEQVSLPVEVQIDETILCAQCKTIIPDSNKFCENCGYPQHGTASEKSKFHADRILSNSKSKEAPRLIKKARNTLFIIAGISFLVGMYYFFIQNNIDGLITSIVLTAAYLILGIWSKEKPLIALVLGLLVYLTTLVINGIVEPSSIYRGILLKGVIIFFLAKGINSALHLRNSK